MSIKTRLDKIESSLVMEEPTVYETITVKIGETKEKALKRMGLPLKPADNVCRWFIFIVGVK